MTSLLVMFRHYFCFHLNQATLYQSASLQNVLQEEHLLELVERLGPFRQKVKGRVRLGMIEEVLERARLLCKLVGEATFSDILCGFVRNIHQIMLTIEELRA